MEMGPLDTRGPTQELQVDEPHTALWYLSLADDVLWAGFY